MLLSVNESDLNQANVNRSDIEGYDLGLIHSQRADFNVLYLSLKQAWSYTSEGDEQNPGSISLSSSTNTELQTATIRAELVTKWPLVAFMLTALFCLGMSTTCHLCYVRNEKVSRIT